MGQKPDVLKNLYQSPWQIYPFVLALLMYGTLGSPTPDHFSWGESIVAAGLVLSLSFSNLRANPFPVAACLYGLTIPLLMGLMAGHSINDILRDTIPFFFLWLGLFYGGVVRHHFEVLIFAICWIGIMFSIRTIFVYRDILLTPTLWGQGQPADLLYLANSPEVLFTALFLTGTALKFFMTEPRVWTGVWKGAGVMLLAGPVLLAMTLMMQRAGLGLVCGVALICSSYYFYMTPKRFLLLLCGLVSGILLTLDFWMLILNHLEIKTEAVGFNGRLQEWTAVLRIISLDPLSLLFGTGWGMKFENPAVGGLSVLFTHSLISSLLLKTGLIGAGLTGFGLWITFKDIHKKISGDPLLLISLVAPLLVGLFLYASYKSLGFGLILLATVSFCSRKLEKPLETMA